MSKLRCHISISADGFVAGPNQSEENPLGEGGERLHDWVVPLAAWREPHGKQGGEVNESTPIMEESLENVGAGVMGRNMFGPPGGGDWGDGEWKGWWGDEPPFHHDVFIVTHHPRDSVEMEGGTTFSFVTDGIETALQRAKESAGGQDVMLSGGAEIIAGAQESFLHGDQWAYTAGIIAVVIGGVLVFFMFPKKEEEEALLGQYHAEDMKALAAMQAAAGSRAWGRAVSWGACATRARRAGWRVPS